MKSEEEIREEINYCKECLERQLKTDHFTLAGLTKNRIKALKWVLEEDGD